jgi:hypothetical protein
MAYPKKTKSRVIQLKNEGYTSAGSIAKKLKSELPGNEDIPTERTIRDWLRKAREGNLQVIETDIYSLKRKEHLERMSEIAVCMLEGGLDSLTNDGTAFYKFGPDQIGQVFYDEFPQMIIANIKLTCSRFGEEDVMNCFIPHLRAEFPENKAKSLDDFLWDCGYSALDALRALARGRPLKGYCHICENWK